MGKLILFDLDGTLLPMDQDIFVKHYFKTITNKLVNYGYDPNELIENIWIATKKMIENDGKSNNKEVFMNFFKSIYGEKLEKDMSLFDEYYINEFNLVKESCGYNPRAKEAIEICKKKGYKIVLATNPIFPEIATINRIKWAGLNPDDFCYITTYENSSYSKPNLQYYRQILSKFNVKENECLMIGNDVNEDMIISEIGVDTFLLTDCLINKNDVDINTYKNGNFNDLIKYLNNLDS